MSLDLIMYYKKNSVFANGAQKFIPPQMEHETHKHPRRCASQSSHTIECIHNYTLISLLPIFGTRSVYLFRSPFSVPIHVNVFQSVVCDCMLLNMDLVCWHFDRVFVRDKNLRFYCRLADFVSMRQ